MANKPEFPYGQFPDEMTVVHDDEAHLMRMQIAYLKEYCDALEARIKELEHPKNRLGLNFVSDQGVSSARERIDAISTQKVDISPPPAGIPSFGATKARRHLRDLVREE